MNYHKLFGVRGNTPGFGSPDSIGAATGFALIDVSGYLGVFFLLPYCRAYSAIIEVDDAYAENLIIRSSALSRLQRFYSGG